MKDKDVKQLIDKYLEGKTSPEEELQLAKTLRRTDIPQEWQAIRLMLGELSLGEAEYDDIMAKRKKKPSAIVIALRVASAIAAILLLVFLYKYNNVQSEVNPVQETSKYAGASSAADTSKTSTYPTPLPEPTNAGQKSLAQEVEKHHVPSRANLHAKSGKSTRKVEQLNVPSSEEVQETPVEEEQTNTQTDVKHHPREAVPNQSDLYLMAATQAQDIRSRGERLREEVALLIEQ